MAKSNTKPKPKADVKANATAKKVVEPNDGAAEVLVTSSRLAKGDRVKHEHFGVGGVVSVRDDKLTIRFENGVVKEIRTDFVRAVKK